jgi:hypothetical protein
MPRQVFTAGEILTAAEMNELADSTVMVFDDSAARGSAIPTPSEGMVTYLKDTNQVQAYDGSSFAPLGTILQVVSTTKTDAFSTTSTSYTAVTGLTASITPSSTSSKILVIVDTNISNANTAGTSATVHVRLTGGNSDDYIGDTAGSRERAAYSLRTIDSKEADLFILARTMTFLDSPNTTSATTYGVEMRVTGSTGVLNRSADDFDSNISGRVPSTITLMEVAG